MNLVRWVEWGVQFLCCVCIDEYPHMGPDIALFVDHAKPDAWKLMVEVFEQLGKGRASRLYLFPLIGVGQQGGRYFYGHLLC